MTQSSCHGCLCGSELTFDHTCERKTLTPMDTDSETRSDFLGLDPDHGIAPLHLSKECFKLGNTRLDPQEFVGKPFNTGHRRFLIAAVEETDRDVIVTLGREIT